MKNYLTKQEAIEYLKSIKIESELETISDTDIITMISKCARGATIKYQSENYSLMKELYNEEQEKNAYICVLTINVD